MAKVKQVKQVEDVQAAVNDAVKNAKLLYPNLPTNALAEVLLDEMDAGISAAYLRILWLTDLSARLRKAEAERRRLEREKQLTLTFHFPAFREHLSVLPVFMRKETLLKTDYRAYLTKLNEDRKEQQSNDKRKIAVQAILKLWPTGRENRGLTVADVDELKAKKAGLV